MSEKEDKTVPESKPEVTPAPSPQPEVKEEVPTVPSAPETEEIKEEAATPSPVPEPEVKEVPSPEVKEEVPATPTPTSELEEIKEEAAAPPLPKVLEGSLEGLVTTSKGPVIGATITFGEKNLVTDQSGRFMIEHIPEGPISLQVTSPSEQFTSTTTTVTIEADKLKDIYVYLSEAPGIIEGVVTDEKGVPLKGALVWGVLSSLEPTTVETDDKGHYVLTDAPAGEHYIRARANGFMTEGQTAHVSGAKSASCDFKLVPGSHSINGKVVNVEGKPVSAELYLMKSGIVVMRKKTEPDGSYSFPSLVPGIYEITLVAGGYNPKGWHGKLEKDEVVEFQLEPMPEIPDNMMTGVH